MNYTSLWIVLSSAATLMVVAYMMFVRFDFFFTYPWLDIPMHALGGFVAGLGVFLLYNHFHAGLLAGLPLAGLVIAGALIIGLAWELFEIVFALTGDAGLTTNTFRDIVMDVVGGALATVLIHYIAFSQMGVV